MAECFETPINVPSGMDNVIAKIEETVRKWEHLKPLQPQEDFRIITTGVLEHGAEALHESDIDVVLLAGNITTDMLLDKKESTKLAENLAEHIKSSFDQEKEEGSLTNLVFKERQHSNVCPGVTFVMSNPSSGRSTGFSVLLCPFWKNQKNFFDFLSDLKRKGDGEWEYYQSLFSPSAALSQVQYILDQPDQVKRLIKGIIKWRNDQWPARSGCSDRPTTYLLSVLVVSACEVFAVEQDLSDTEDLDGDLVVYHELAERVTDIIREGVINHKAFKIDLEEHLSDYPTADINGPYILDPANPFNNLYVSGVVRCDPEHHFGDYGNGNGNWQSFVDKIHTLDLTKSE